MSQRLLLLEAGEAVDYVEKIYARESSLIDPAAFSRTGVLKLHLGRLLLETARCLPGHLGFRFAPRGGRCFSNADNLLSVLEEAARDVPVCVGDSGIWKGNVTLSQATDLAITRAFALVAFSPISQVVEETYARERFKSDIFDLIWAYCRVNDLGPNNAFLCVSHYANTVLDDTNSREQMYRDFVFHRATGGFPEGAPFTVDRNQLSLASLGISWKNN